MQVLGKPIGLSEKHQGRVKSCETGMRFSNLLSSSEALRDGSECLNVQSPCSVDKPVDNQSALEKGHTIDAIVYHNAYFLSICTG